MAPYTPRTWLPPAPSIEAAVLLAAVAAGLALLALLPYDDISRIALCFKFHAGYGCAN